MKSTTLKTDFVIAGGGPVGLMLAIGLSQQGFEVVLAERFSPVEQGVEVKNSFDGRVLEIGRAHV